MLNTIHRDEKFLNGLCSQLKNQYGLHVLKLTQARRGFYGETWEAFCSEGIYFIKWIGYRPRMSDYMRSFSVIRHMKRNGINFISDPVATEDGYDFCLYRDGVLGVQLFVSGEHTEDYLLDDLLRLLVQCYKVPVDGLEIYREAFDLREYEGYMRTLHIAEQINLPGWDEVSLILNQNADKLDHYLSRLNQAISICKNDQTGFVLTSGDVGGNVIVNGDIMTIVDWDHMTIAPPERDLWFYMQDMRQIEQINQVLREENFPYTIKNERLMFFCYSRMFFYLMEFIGAGLYMREFNNQLINLISENISDNHFLNLCKIAADKW